MNSDSDMFSLDANFVSKYAFVKPPFGFNGLGELVYKRTYSRIKTDGTKEKWVDTIERVINGCYRLQQRWILDNNLGWDNKKAQESAQEMFDRMFNMKFLPAGRNLWAMGTNITDKKGLYVALCNCAFITTNDIKNDPSQPFCFLMDNCMLGVGVSMDVRDDKDIKINQPVGEQKYIIEDTREGWVDALRCLILSFTKSEGHIIKFDYSKIRPQGLPLKVFGGVSSGPKPLEELLESIREIFQNNIGKFLSMTMKADIANLIGVAVVAGNIRRTAILLLGDPDSEEFQKLKDYNKNPHRIKFGWTSNNSISAYVGMDYSNASSNTVKNGEPGYVWLDNCRKYSRMSEPEDNKDKRCAGVNPCISGDTLVLTTKGLIRVCDLVGKKFRVVMNGKEYESSDLGFWKSGNKDVYELKLKNGFKLKCTDNHKILCLTNDKKEWKELKHIQIGTKICVFNNTYSEVCSITFKDYYVEVFDCSINEIHCLYANGIIVHNCGEMTLEDGELCNLVEMFPLRCKDLDDYKRTLKFAYLYGKTITLGQSHWAVSNRKMLRNRRIGCSVSGIAQFITKYDLLQSKGESKFSGIETLRKWFEEGIKVLDYYDDIYSEWLSIPKSIKKTVCKPSGCIRPDMMIETSMGLLRLDEIGNINGEKWQTIDSLYVPSKQLENEKVNKFYVNGNVETRLIRTSDGNELESSLQHKYYVINKEGKEEWKETKDLTTDDKLMVKLGGHCENIITTLKKVDVKKCYKYKITQPETLTPELSWFIGYYYGNGNNHKIGIRLHMNTKYTDIIEWLMFYIKKEFNITPCICRDKRANAIDIYASSGQLLEWLRENKIFKEKSYNIKVPLLIRTASKENVKSFIDGFWSADGGFRSMCSTSKQFMTEMFCLCRGVGYNVRIRNDEKSSVKSKNGWGNRDRYVIYNRMGFDDLHKIGKFGREKISCIPYKIRERYYTDGNNNQFWLDPIISIEKSTHDTYDIEVENTHHYLLNGGVVSHNTISLLAGATPGIHYPESRFYIRRVRLAKHSELIPPLLKSGYTVVPDIYQPESTMIVEFPIDTGEGIRTVNEMSMWEQLSLNAFVQRFWSDNSVSVTIKFDPITEAEQVKHALNYFQYQLKSVSFLPKYQINQNEDQNEEQNEIQYNKRQRVSKEKTIKKIVYQQAPYEEISEEKYNELKRNLKELNLDNIKDKDSEEEKFCDGESCLLKTH